MTTSTPLEIRKLPSNRWYWHIPGADGETNFAFTALVEMWVWTIRKKIGGEL